MRRDRRRYAGFLSFARVSLLCVTALGAPAFLSACSDEQPRSFPPYQFGYLGQIHLNVATLQPIDHATPSAGDEASRAPIPPDQALLQLAQDRLAATGQSGSATFTIDQASIVHGPGGTLSGRMDVHIDVLSPTGQQLGVAEAHVTRDFKPNLDSGNADSEGNLYDLTKQMTQDMNVELEFQIKRNLRDWLVDAGGMPTDGAIQTQSLDGSPQQSQPATAAAASVASPAVSAAGVGATVTANAPVADGTGSAATAEPVGAPAAAASAAPAASAEPDAIFPSGDPGAPDTAKKTLSPKPGVLQLPTKATKTQSAATSTSGY
ncbi:hypothetical protein [Acetobacter sacchari]|uniref:hypothetical protein n=1 Tax=Acetobacter sacchari TaxID=2661687 RepID=UPI001FB00D7C|nr:hypothetical protein [Acetobacter sacchari]